MAKALIVFYSRRGQNLVGGEVRTLAKGNTELAAEYLRHLTGADLFQIRQREDYPEDYYRCIDQAWRDFCRNVRPELLCWPDSIDPYDTIYLGYPNYWGTMPMAVFSFLERFDFTGKTIKPFCTHDGGGLGRSIQDLRQTCPTAHIAQGLSLCGARIRYELETLGDWIGGEEVTAVCAAAIMR